jgi:predicted aspartyl protease
LIAAFEGLEMGKVEAPENPGPIRFQKSLNLLFAEVMINGQGPFSFVIDTGASQTVFSEQLSLKLGLPPLTTTVIHGVGGLGKIESRIFRADELKIGDVTVRNLPVGTFSDPLVSSIADGIIGTSMLSDFVLTINYPENQLELHRAAPAPAENAERIPAWYFNNLLLIPLQVNGHTGNFLIDTGAVTTVLSHTMAAAMGVNEDTPGAKLNSALAGVGGIQGAVLQVPGITMKTARYTEEFEQLISIDLKSISRMIETELAGVVGFDFLENYRVTIDYTRAEVWLSK